MKLKGSLRSGADGGHRRDAPMPGAKRLTFHGAAALDLENRVRIVVAHWTSLPR